MAAGRPPKPTALKLVEGNKGKRAISSHEPDPEYLNDLTPPARLPDAAKEIWNEIAPALRAAKVLTKLDVHALSMGCIALAQYYQSVQETGGDLVVETSKGGKQINQMVIAQSMFYKQVQGIFAQFGLSPAARTRIAINPQEDLFGNAPAGKNYFS